MVWLHDRYELGLEERLPRCWPSHPGLVEELTALKAWRIEIYSADHDGGQAARYWHAELRQVITAATTLYAAGCRVGHHPAPTGDSALRRQWLDADPLLGVPAAMLGELPQSWDGELLAEDAMRRTLAAGEARPLGETVREFVRHDNSWWSRTPAGDWVRVTDDLFAAELDRAATRMARADEAVQLSRRFSARP